MAERLKQFDTEHTVEDPPPAKPASDGLLPPPRRHAPLDDLFVAPPWEAPPHGYGGMGFGRAEAEAPPHGYGGMGFGRAETEVPPHGYGGAGFGRVRAEAELFSNGLEQRLAQLGQKEQELQQLQGTLREVIHRAEADGMALRGQVSEAQRAVEVKAQEAAMLDQHLKEVYVKGHEEKQRGDALQTKLDQLADDARRAQEALEAKLEVERRQKEEALAHAAKTEQQLQVVSADAAKIGQELLAVYKEFGETQEAVKALVQRIDLLETGSLAERKQYETQLAELRASSEQLNAQFQAAREELAGLQAANCKLTEDAQTAVMARKFVEAEKLEVEKSLSKLAGECEVLRAELIAKQRECETLAAHKLQLIEAAEQDKRDIAHLTGDLAAAKQENTALLQENHAAMIELAEGKDSLEKTRFELNLVNDAKELLAAKLRTAEQSLVAAEVAFNKDLKGAQEMAAVAIVEKEQAMRELQAAKDEIARFQFAASTAIEREAGFMERQIALQREVHLSALSPRS